MRNAIRGGLVALVVVAFAACGPFWTKSIESTGGRLKTYTVAVSFGESDVWRDLKTDFEPIPTDPIAQRLVRPSTLFAWGVYRPDGWAVFLGSTAVYLAAYFGSVLLVRRAAVRVGCPRAGFVLGLLGLCPMVVWCGESVSLQLTSVNATRAHRDAIVMLAGTILVIAGVAGVVELTTRGRKSEPHAATRPRP